MQIKKRGQLSIWIILAVVLVATITLLFALNINRPKINNVDTSDIHSYLEQCISVYLEETADKMLSQGGFINPSNTIYFQGMDVEYLCEGIGFFEPCINQHPMLIEEMKQEITVNLRPQVITCFQNLEDEFERRGGEIIFNDPLPLVQVNLTDNRILLNIKRKTTIIKGEQTESFEMFHIEITHPIYNFATVVREISWAESFSCSFDYQDIEEDYPRFSITRNNLLDTTKIYVIQDSESGKIMNVAIKGCQKPFSKTLIHLIPGITPLDYICYEEIDSVWNDCLGITCSGDLAGIAKFLRDTAPTICTSPGLDFLISWINSLGGVKVCEESLDNKICQQYPTTDCDSNCKEPCLDTDMTQNELPLNSPCKLGVCFDENEKTCQANSPKDKCRNFGGDWKPEGTLDQCKKGCCILGKRSLLTTLEQCEKKAEFLGLIMNRDVIFTNQITNPEECKLEEIGSCKYIKDSEENCLVTTKRECNSLNGDFEVEASCPPKDIVQRIIFPETMEELLEVWERFAED